MMQTQGVHSVGLNALMIVRVGLEEDVGPGNGAAPR